MNTKNSKRQSKKTCRKWMSAWRKRRSGYLFPEILNNSWSYMEERNHHSHTLSWSGLYVTKTANGSNVFVWWMFTSSVMHLRCHNWYGGWVSPPDALHGQLPCRIFGTCFLMHGFLAAWTAEIRNPALHRCITPADENSSWVRKAYYLSKFFLSKSASLQMMIGWKW